MTTPFSPRPRGPRTDSLMLRCLVHLAACGALIQLVVGLLVAFTGMNVLTLHKGVALCVLVSALGAMVLGFMQNARSSAATIVLGCLALAQYALGEMHIEHVHMGIGLLFLGIAVWASVQVQRTGVPRAE